MSQLDMCTSPAMSAVRDMVAKVATTSAAVLLTGESGVGKEVVARAIHRASPRAANQFVKVNCAALPGELLESELFGHQRGAFTGAHRDKPGKFELAEKGTILLDEIGEVPLRLQAKLLHVLQDGEFARVGGERILHTDVRVLAATNRDLAAEIRSGRFREDLYYRLNVIEIRIPPLRERREEIPVLIDHFLKTANAAYRRSVEIAPSARRLLLEYSWPGNIRQLENVIKRVVVLGNAAGVYEELAAASKAATSATMPAPAAPVVDLAGPLDLKSIARRAARDAERIAIADMLQRTRWNRAKAARLLGISYKALLYKIVDCGLATKDEAEVSPPPEAPAPAALEEAFA
ncbi:MAG TPA: sigma-54 dependent transcriptional regulator [Methylomirabilota bacterium]|jgi:two-component system, NtrC family, response regulator AtoC|nr:sigma-54 dependent transcriptional regulator [Methylomirabilota bacterium]